jgi:hypothetical protein
MRKEDFRYCYPFPHYRNRDVDWDLAKRSPNAVLKRSKRIFVLSDYVLHLGLKESTWNNENWKDYHSEEEIIEVEKILKESR